ncbi:MAG: transporter ATP-binding protein [Paenibacillaceae bacterium]|jgi:ATPase subunit of ABC transporter with duplicated ATPase domains|nr:transporter ATP-binding protein [Paenibacillaceae bacterium]
MIVISCQHIKKYHAANLVLEDVTFELHEGEKIGIIGSNGSGKTTLLQMIAGVEPIDEGQLFIKKGSKIGYLSQFQYTGELLTVYDALSYGCRELLACQNRMAALEEGMSRPRGDSAGAQKALERLLQQYAEEQEFFERGGGYELDSRIAQVAAGLGIGREQFPRQYATLSGGEKTKVALGTLLIARPDVLLLDEPTNHLDLEGVEWLETYIGSYPGACLMVSHDRYFLDRVAAKIVELEDGESSLYLTNYSGYVQEKEERLLRQFAEYQEQQKTIRKMRETIRQLEEWGRIGSNEKFFRRAASMQKALDRMEKIKRPVLDPKTAEFDWKLQDRSGRRVAVLEGVTKHYGSKQVLNQVEGLLEFGEKVALVGKNGSGKTTLFKLLLGLEQADKGSLQLGARVEPGYLAQEEQPSSLKETVLDYFRKEARLEEGEARARLARYLFYGAAVFKPLCGLSGGEWTRLRLALLVHNKPNLLLLDEPTNHLDIASREALEENLEEFPGTILAISHDRYFMNKLVKRVWELKEGRLASYPGSFDDYREKARQQASAAEQAALQAGQAVSVPERGRAAAPPLHPPAPGRPAIAQIEAAAASGEARLKSIDEQLAEAGNASDHALLNQLWMEREQVSLTLERLYEEWILVKEE